MGIKYEWMNEKYELEIFFLIMIILLFENFMLFYYGKTCINNCQYLNSSWHMKQAVLLNHSQTQDNAPSGFTPQPFALSLIIFKIISSK